MVSFLLIKALQQLWATNDIVPSSFRVLGFFDCLFVWGFSGLVFCFVVFLGVVLFFVTVWGFGLVLFRVFLFGVFYCFLVLFGCEFLLVKRTIVAFYRLF